MFIDYVLFSGLIIMPIIIVIIMCVAVIKMAKSRHWLAIKATILKSELKYKKNGSQLIYTPSITYKYIYEKKEYTSNQYDFYGESCSKREKYEKILQKLPKDKKIICYVNPHKSADAVLNSDLKFRPIIPIVVIAIIFLLIGSVGMYHLISSGRGPFDPPAKYFNLP